MNQSKSNAGPAGLSPRAWKQIAAIAVVVLIAGYAYCEPTLERWFGVDLPSITGNDNNNQADNNPRPDNKSKPNNDLDWSIPGKTAPTDNQPDKTGRSTKSNSDPSKQTATSEKDIYKDFFKSAGNNKYISPEGLVYTSGPGGEHRIDHVLRHGKDIPDRPTHSVFDGDEYEIFELIDKVYKMIKDNSKYVKSNKEGNRTEYTVTLGRRVGHDGGQKGRRNNNKPLTSVRLILQSGNNVITAYPYR